MTKKLAFENVTGPLFELSDSWIQDGIVGSRQSSRKRIILPIHRKQDAQVQRMINFMQPGTYIRPHKHPLPHATESLVLLKGSIRYYTFDDDGNIKTDHIVSAEPLPGVLDMEPDTWHSFIVLEPDTILFECKKGPYDADTDKIFASWSPPEDDPDVPNWLNRLN